MKSKKLILIPVLTLMMLLMVSSVLAVGSEIVTGDKTFTVTPSGEVIVELEVANVGVDPSEMFLIELQPVFSSPLTFVGLQETCDPSHPKNVHVDVQLTQADSRYLYFKTPPLAVGKYDIKMVSTDSCCIDNDQCQAVEPFGWGRIIGTVEVLESTAQPECGNDICESNEDANKCANDCSSMIGDGFCTHAETFPTEPACEGDATASFWDVVKNIKPIYLLSLSIIGIVIVGGLLIKKK